MSRIIHVAALCIAAGLLANCASPQSHFYTLTASATATAEAPVSVAVVVGPVAIPAVVDLPQIVVTTGPNQVALDEFHRWAAPLASTIGRVVVTDLTTLLGAARVFLLQDGLPTPLDFRVSIAVQSFESVPGVSATLSAVWTVRDVKSDAVQTGHTSVSEPCPDKSYEALAAAHSKALAQMSQEIAAAIRAMGHGKT